MNYTLLHDLTFYAMYATAALGVYVIVERLIFFHFTLHHSRQAVAGAGAHGSSGLQGVVGEIHDAMVRERRSVASREELCDRSEAIYLTTRPVLLRRLWLLDTIVTAAPLLGLLGTILGIIETFSALAQSGISDPAAVSRGIGTALFATALGIAIALFGLVFNNLFQDKVEEISNNLKAIILKAGAAGAAPRDASREAAHRPHQPAIAVSA